MQQRGFSLLEIMISSFILALGLLGLAGMQSTAVKSSVEIQQRTLANSLIADISERMLLNKVWVQQSGNSYAIDSIIDADLEQPECISIGSGGAFVNCSGEAIKNNDLFEWKDKFIGAHVVSPTGIESGLIGADACIESDSTGKSTIVLSWYSTVKSLDAAINQGVTSLYSKCGEASAHRRQISVDTYISKSS